MRLPHFSFLLFTAFWTSLPARAEEAATLVTTRELAKQAFQAYDEGRFEEAADKSQRAYQVARVPTIAVVRARALVQLGKWVAASELYLEASRLPRDPGWQVVQDEAVTNADRERAELLPRIPRVKVVIDGVPMASVNVRIDGTAMPAALLDAEIAVDPGERVVTAQSGGQELRQIVLAKASELTMVTLHFAQRAAAPATQLPSVSRGVASKPTVTASNAVTIAGWAAVGVGTAGIAWGVLEGFSAKSKRTSLFDTGLCSSDGTHCDRSLASQVDAYRSARTLSMVGVYAGAAVAAAGVTLLVLPFGHRERTDLGFVIKPGYLGIRGAL